MDTRLQIVTPSGGTARETFAPDVRAGLTSTPKTLPPKYLYDEKGSMLFEQICNLPEYYLTKVETRILQQHSAEFIDALEHDASIVELGSGSSTKTRILMETLLKRHADGGQRHEPFLHYMPIDISRSAIEESAASLLKDYKGLHITAYVGDYHAGLQAIPRDPEESRLFLFLGANIGNFEKPDAVKFLRTICSVMGQSDRLLMGVDLKKNRATLEAAYDDSQGVTAAFNLNLLVRMNRELESNFDLAAFRHRAYYDEALGRVELHLESLKTQRVTIPKANVEATFERGETIHTENSYKYSLEQIGELCAAGKFSLNMTRMDEEKLFSLNLLAPMH